MNLEKLEMMRSHLQELPPEKTDYIIYARKSSESEDKQVESIPEQTAVLNELSLNKGLHVREVFSESRSAKKPGRPEFNRMIEDIDKAGGIQGIIVWKLNRLFRNPEDEGKIRQMLSDGRIKEIITPSKTYYEADSDFIMAVEGAQAQRFIRDLREDTARGVNSKLKKGIAPILAPPGYKNDTSKRQGERDIVPHDIQFTLVRKLFELYMTGNYSVEALHRKAEELGVRSNRGKIVSHSQLHQMLRNPFYTGVRFMYAGRLYTNGAHKRMLEDEEFDLIQSILTSRSNPRGIVRTNLLTGLMKCGECGMSITSEVKTKHYRNGTSQQFVYYRCTKKRSGIRCSQPYINAKKLEGQVMEYLEQIQLPEKIVSWGIKWLSIMHKKQVELRQAKYKDTESQYREVIRKIDKLSEMVMAEFLTIEEAKIKKQELELEKERLSRTLSKIDDHVSEINSLTIETFDFIKNVQDKFKNGTIEQRKTILRVVGSNLIVKDGNLLIVLRKPFEYIQNTMKQISLKPTALSGPSEGHWGDLPDEVRTYYASLPSYEFVFYKQSYQFLNA